LRLVVRPSPPPAGAVALGDAGTASGDLSRLLGAEEVPQAAAIVPASTRFKLLGVMAGKPELPGLAGGVALISIDGKPARTFAAGARVEDQLVLKTLGLRSAALGPANGPPAFVLEIPPLPLPATGTLDHVQGAQAYVPSPPPDMQPPPMMPPEQPSIPQPGDTPFPGASMAPEPPSGLGPQRLRDGSNGSGR
jgi:general secretion pathway protein C